VRFVSIRAKRASNVAAGWVSLFVVGRFCGKFLFGLTDETNAKAAEWMPPNATVTDARYSLLVAGFFSEFFAAW